MNNPLKLNRFKFLLPYFLLALAIIVAYRVSGGLHFFNQIWIVASPFFYGFLLAYILNMPCSSIRRQLARSKNKFIFKGQKLLSVLITLLILVLIIVVSLILIIPAITKSISLFIDSIPDYWESVVGYIHYINNLRLFRWNISEEKIFEQLGNMFGDFSIENLLRPIMNAGTAAIGGLVAFISAIYILLEKDRLIALIHRLFRVFASEKASFLATEVCVRLNKYFRQYIRTQTIDGIIVSILTIILLFILRSPYALVLGIILFVLNYIPYVGSILGTVIAIILVTFTQGITKGAISAVSLLIIQLLDANFIQPKLMSESFKISPYLVIVSITVGGAIAGTLGMIVAIPIVAVLKDIFDSVVDHYEYKKFGKVEREHGFNKKTP
ncbi:MAG: AI-2E family transporter [Defluviitaleaceae bacterium]|nr:AI-2E family transporter [Defluviitaleaceae bacterium]